MKSADIIIAAKAVIGHKDVTPNERMLAELVITLSLKVVDLQYKVAALEKPPATPGTF